MPKISKFYIQSYYIINFLLLALFCWTLDPAYSTLKQFMPLFQISIFLWIVFSLIQFGKSFKSYNSLTKKFLVLQIVAWGILICLYHPGFVNADTFGLQYGLHMNVLSPWNTIFFSILTDCFFQIDPTLFLYSLFYIFIYISCQKKCFDICQIKNKKTGVLLFVTSFFPIIQVTIFYLSRDILFGLLTCYVLLCFGEVFLKEIKIDVNFIFRTSFLVLVLSELRQDAKFYLIAFPILLWGLSRYSISKLRIITITLGLFLISASINLAFNKNGIQAYDRKYQLTAIFHQLNYIVYQAHEEITQEEKEKISAVINFQSLIDSYNPNQISQFHNKMYTTDVSEKTWHEFILTYEKLIYRFKFLFFQERTKLFLTSLNLIPGAFIYSNEFDSTNEFSKRVRDELKVSRWNLMPELASWYNAFQNNVLFFGNVYPIPGLIFSSPVFLLLVSILIVLKNEKLRIFYFFSTLFFASRFPVVFFLAPEPQMKYYSVLMYFPLFVIFIGKNISDQKKADGISTTN